MPALNKAREQAKTLMCSANCRQLSTLINIYRADNNGAVPIVLNRWAPNGPGADDPKAKNNYISLGLRDYSATTKNLPTNRFDPSGTWGLLFTTRVAEYVEKYLPKFYACPYVRSKKGDAMRYPDGNVNVSGVTYSKQTFKGRFESFSVSLYGRSLQEHWPAWAGDLKPKYAALPWNSTADNGMAATGKFDLKNQIKWGSKRHLSQYRESNGGYMPLRISSMSETTVAYCLMGESRDYDGYLSNKNIIFNYGSHRKRNSGGTNAIFADNHSEWVPGDQIGWH
jgi:hypothetical protein